MIYVILDCQTLTETILISTEKETPTRTSKVRKTKKNKKNEALKISNGESKGMIEPRKNNNLCFLTFPPNG